MAITGLEDISFSKEEIKEEVGGSVNTTKTLIFKHQASAGELLINTTALSTPAEAAANGFTQPSLAEVAELQLLVNKKNLKIHSSRGIWLQMYEDFVVQDAHTIRLIGNIADSGGALEGEVFTVYATPVQANTVLTTDAKKMYQEYVLPDGQTLLNLGREYSVNTNSAYQIGSIRVFRNGQGPLLRNVGNVAADPLADGNYQEIDAGNGIGTTIEFNVAPSGQDDVIVVEFGLEYAGDLSIVGDIESLYGAFKKLIEDAAPAFGWPESRYLNFNPSEVERRTFGDLVYLWKQYTARQPEYSALLNFSTTSDTFVDVTNGTVTITNLTGRPMLIALTGDGTGATTGAVFGDASGSNAGQAVVGFSRGSTAIFQGQNLAVSAVGGATDIRVPPSAYWVIDTPGIGTHTYKVQLREVSAGTATLENCRLMVVEL
jgi:hypothetical protein